MSKVLGAAETAEKIENRSYGPNTLRDGGVTKSSLKHAKVIDISHLITKPEYQNMMGN